MEELILFDEAYSDLYNKLKFLAYFFNKKNKNDRNASINSVISVEFLSNLYCECLTDVFFGDSDDFYYVPQNYNEFNRNLHSKIKEFFPNGFYSGINYFFDCFENKKYDDIFNVFSMFYDYEKSMYDTSYLDTLIGIRDDLVIDMNYFMSRDEIDNFMRKYDSGISRCDDILLKNLLNEYNSKVLEEWNKYINFSKDKFCFVGHSLKNARFSGDFYSRFVSCSLYNEEVFDTFNENFGFILDSKNIIAANSFDLYSFNYSEDADYLFNEDRFFKIKHPQRIIDECKVRKDNVLKLNECVSIYNEVVIDGFNPVGIFAFTNGLYELEDSYVNAYKLKRKYPNLDVFVYDVMKNKKGIDLTVCKLEIIKNLFFKFDLPEKLYGDCLDFTYVNKYSYFFNKLDILKKGEYNSLDIENIFRFNHYLLNISDIDELFSGKFNDECIKFVLGQGNYFNIDYILSSCYPDVVGYKFLSSLSRYSDRLDKYYNGLGYFVNLLSTYDIDDSILEILNDYYFESFDTLSHDLIKGYCKKKGIYG